jgi:hypothetical protein
MASSSDAYEQPPHDKPIALSSFRLQLHSSVLAFTRTQGKQWNLP